MKRLIAFVLALVLSAGLIPPQAALAGQQAIGINVNGQRIKTDVAPIISSGRTLVPIRFIAEKLGAEVSWIPDWQEVIIKYNDNVVSMQINNNQVSINGKVNKIDVPPVIYSGRTMVPLRFIAETMGMQVGWVPEASVATVTAPDYFDTLPASTVLGFTTNDYKGDNISHQSLVKNSSSISSIATFSYQVDYYGNLKLTGQPQKNSVDIANSSSKKSLLLVHNLVDRKFDRSIAYSVLSNAEKRQKLINNILVAMSKESYAGVNVDIENVGSSNRNYYSTFIKELKEKLAPYGFLTTVSIPAKTSDNYSDGWSGGFNYYEIGKYADQVLIMTYDEHFFGGTAGPISSYPWVENVLKYATRTMPSNKVLLGVAAYGYDWSVGGSRVVMQKNADSIISKLNVTSMWNEDLKSPYFTYNKDGYPHEVWYEDTRSIGVKLDLVKTYNLGGIGIWKLGYENDVFWSLVKDKIG